MKSDTAELHRPEIPLDENWAHRKGWERSTLETVDEEHGRSNFGKTKHGLNNLSNRYIADSIASKGKVGSIARGEIR